MEINTILKQLDWDKSPLIPTIAQDISTKRVLMLAWTNEKTLSLSIKTKLAHYYSRSKKRVWKKGETSQNVQKIRDILLDCDRDTLLFVVEQINGSCHEGTKTCFNKNLLNIKSFELPKQSISSNYSILDKVYHRVISKKKEQETNSANTTSYAHKLFRKGENTILKKIAEEAAEFCFAIKDDNQKDIIHEAADLVFHTVVGLAYRGIDPDRIMQELSRRYERGSSSKQRL